MRCTLQCISWDFFICSKYEGEEQVRSRMEETRDDRKIWTRRFDMWMWICMGGRAIFQFWPSTLDGGSGGLNTRSRALMARRPCLGSLVLRAGRLWHSIMVHVRLLEGYYMAFHSTNVAYIHRRIVPESHKEWWLAGRAQSCSIRDLSFSHSNGRLALNSCRKAWARHELLPIVV
jgi:hypothetical protein